MDNEDLDVTPGGVKKVVNETVSSGTGGAKVVDGYKETTIDDLRRYKATPEELAASPIIEFEKMDEKVKELLPKEDKKLHYRKIPLGAAANHFPTYAYDILEMNDPYSREVRNLFTDCALTDPSVRTPLRRRRNSFLANGFHLELEMKSDRNPKTDVTFTPEEFAMINAEVNHSPLVKFVKMLEDWANRDEVNILERMKEALFLGIVQGRSLMRIIPPMSQLPKDILPLMCRRVPAEETGNVILNRRFAAIIGVRYYSILEGTGVALPDGMVYCYFNDSSLRRFEQYYGRSDLESILQLSRVNKKIINYDYPKAITSAYMPKLFGKISVSGSKEEKDKYLQETAARFANQDAVLIEAAEESEIGFHPVQVNQPMISEIRADIQRIMIPALGTTNLKMGETDQLTRDNATIMEVEEKREIRQPDEMYVFKFFENQLFNPLFSHLSGIDFEKLPVKVKIVRNPPDDETAMLEDKMLGNDMPMMPPGGGPLEEPGLEGGKPMTEQQENQNPAGLGASGDLVIDLPPAVRKKAIEYYDSLKEI